MARYFTHAEAEKLLPEIDQTLRDILQLKNTRDAADEELKQWNNRITMMGGTNVHPGDFLKLRARRDGAILGLKDAIDRLQSYGCLLKDFDKGLVDFPTLYHGQEVYLCWKRGEDRIDYWHGVSEGFAGRKAIDEEFLTNHRGGVQ